MSQEYAGRDKLDIAAEAERDLNSSRLKQGVQEGGTGFGGKDDYGKASDSARESGIDQSVTNRFPGSTAEYGSRVTGREIPPEEGGDVQKGTGKMTKDVDFDQGEAGQGPEDVARERALNYGGEDDVTDKLRGVNAEKNTSRIDK